MQNANFALKAVLFIKKWTFPCPAEIHVSVQNRSSEHREQNARIEYDGIGFIPVHKLTKSKRRDRVTPFGT